MYGRAARALCKQFSMTSQQYRGICEPPAEYMQKLTEPPSKAEGRINFGAIFNKNMSGNVCCKLPLQYKEKYISFNFKFGKTHVSLK